eukprot:c2468_g1_i1.p2 GENE.c2468_g1_i1~~c2468_g1_i1.p2  ORF type:complete len:146 (-),score=41.17 c2468_g1_i1:381-818(-)
MQMWGQQPSLLLEQRLLLPHKNVESADKIQKKLNVPKWQPITLEPQANKNNLEVLKEQQQLQQAEQERKAKWHQFIVTSLGKVDGVLDEHQIATVLVANGFTDHEVLCTMTAKIILELFPSLNLADSHRIATRLQKIEDARSESK